MNPFLSDRENKILDLLTKNYNLTVTKLSELLGVSAVTVRSDLSSMEEKGIILRTRGGALPVYHPDILASQKRNPQEKNRIAKSAASLLKEGDTVMIDDGITTSLVMKYLLGKRDIHVVTNSSLALTYGRVNPTIHLTLVGGEFKPPSESIVGPVAIANLKRYHVNYAFVGTGGFSINKGMTTNNEEAAEIIKAMEKQADKIVLLAESAKYNTTGFVTILPLNSVDMLITDTGMSDEMTEEITALGVEFMRV